MRRRWIRIAGGAVALIVLAAVVASFFIDEPLRRTMERRINARLDGYTVRVGRLAFHPIGFSLDFGDLVLVQNAHPDPPIAQIARWTTSVHWRALLRGRLVADFEVERPNFHIDLTNLRREAEDQVPIETRGWQEAVQAMYPLKIDLIRIRDGELTYVDENQGKPLTLSRVQARAENIRNIVSKDRVYPSTLRVDAVVFDRGTLVIDGDADFLAEPYLGVLAEVRLDQIDLEYFRPVLARYGVDVRRGVLAAKGNVEYAPKIKAVALEEASVRGVELDYASTPATAGQGKQAAHATVKAAEQVSNQPEMQFRIGQLRVTGTFGFVNKKANPSYRVFLGDTELQLRNLSNHFTEGPASVRLTGKFMGSGDTLATGTFRSELNGPDFDVGVRIVDTDMRAMNDLLRAHGKFDVVGGLFSFFTELKVKDRTVTGYVKPLFRNLDVYDKRQDKEKGLFRKLYEGLIGGVAKLLENVPRDEVATKAEVHGTIDQPKASTIQVVVRLVQNAFFKAILPGFDREIGRGRR